MKQILFQKFNAIIYRFSINDYYYYIVNRLNFNKNPTDL